MPRTTLTPEERRAKNAAKQAARRAAMTPEERVAYVLYQRQKNAEYRARHRQRLRAKARQKRLDNGEQMRAAERQRRKEHPGQYSDRKGAWLKAHPEQARAACKKWRAANTDKVKAANDQRPKPLPRNPEADHAYYLLHAEHISANVKAWKKANPARARLNAQIGKMRRRARLAAVSRNDVTPAQRHLVIEVAQGRCAYCPHYNPACPLCRTGAHTDLTVDHITAVFNGGNNTLHNLVACCGTCNAKKGTKKHPLPVQPLLL